MEHDPSAAQNAAYDYRACARVWHRVAPTLTPYPEARAAMAADTADDGLTAAEREAELSLPGAQADPCCMGSAATESLEVLQGFLREELADRRTYLFLARRAPTAEARGVFRTLAEEEGRHARKLAAALYLITGERYCPAICYPPLQLPPRLAGDARPLSAAAPAGVLAGRIPPCERHAVSALRHYVSDQKGGAPPLPFRVFRFIPSR